MKSVNPHIMAQLNARMFSLQVKMLKGNRLDFFQEYEAMIASYEKQIWGFVPSGFITATEPTGKVYNVREHIRELLPTKKEGGLLDWRDDSIVESFGDINFTDTEPNSGRIYFLKKEFGNGNLAGMMNDAVIMDIYKSYDIVPALLLANSLIAAGAVNDKNPSLLIELKNQIKDHWPCRLQIRKAHDGRVGVNMKYVCPDDVVSSGDGVLLAV